MLQIEKAGSVAGFVVGFASEMASDIKTSRRLAAENALSDLCDPQNIDTLSKGPGANAAEIVKSIDTIIRNR